MYVYKELYMMKKKREKKRGVRRQKEMDGWILCSFIRSQKNKIK